MRPCVPPVSQELFLLLKELANRKKELLWLYFALQQTRLPAPPQVWATALDQLSQRIRQYFGRPESHQRALTYIQRLMSNASRKNA